MKINEHNCESYLLDYVDGELTDVEQNFLFQYLEQHPERKKELKLLQKTKLEPYDSIGFPDKPALYSHKMNPKKTIVLPWRKIGAAAAVAACLLFVVFFYFHQKPLYDNEQNKSIANIEKTPVHPPRHEATSVKKAQPAAASVGSDTVNNAGSKSLLAAQNPSEKVEEKAHEPVASSVSRSSSKRIHKEALAAVRDRPNKPVIPIKPLAEETRFSKNEIAMKADSLHEVISPDIPKIQKLAVNEKMNPLQQVQSSKDDFDSTFTDKLYALQDKLTHPLKKVLNIKKIKIGNLSFVFNH